MGKQKKDRYKSFYAKCVMPMLLGGLLIHLCMKGDNEYEWSVIPCTGILYTVRSDICVLLVYFEWDQQKFVYFVSCITYGNSQRITHKWNYTKITLYACRL